MYQEIFVLWAIVSIFTGFFSYKTERQIYRELKLITKVNEDEWMFNHVDWIIFIATAIIFPIGFSMIWFNLNRIKKLRRKNK